MKWIKDLEDGDTLAEVLLVKSAVKGITDKGVAYLNVVFQDKTGTISARKWDATQSDVDVLAPGGFAYIEGVVNLYRGQRQVKVTGLAPVANPASVDVRDYRAAPPTPVEDLKARLDAYLNSFKDPDIALVTKTIINKVYDKYVNYPAAIRIHHEFGSGLILHSLAEADLAEAIAKLYPSVDRDLLVAGTILHDVGKTVEYSYANNLTAAETTEGRLIGHISIMYGLFREIVDPLNIKSEVPLLLEHMVLAHHGKLEFGSPVLPATREALLLSMIDLLDSRMMILDKALKDTKPGEFTEKLWPLDNVAFYKPKIR